jgi:hypothetical protein
VSRSPVCWSGGHLLFALLTLCPVVPLPLARRRVLLLCPSSRLRQLCAVVSRRCSSIRGTDARTEQALPSRIMVKVLAACARSGDIGTLKSMLVHAEAMYPENPTVVQSGFTDLLGGTCMCVRASVTECICLDLSHFLFFCSVYRDGGDSNGVLKSWLELSPRAPLRFVTKDVERMLSAAMQHADDVDVMRAVALSMLTWRHPLGKVRRARRVAAVACGAVV